MVAKFMVFVLGFITGGLVVGYVIVNNKNKAFAALAALKTKAEEELTNLKK